MAGQDPYKLDGRQALAFKKKVQTVFQDTAAALDPRMTVGASIQEGLHVHGIGTTAERQSAVSQMLERVGLEPAIAARYPHMLSGGQRPAREHRTKSHPGARNPDRRRAGLGAGCFDPSANPGPFERACTKSSISRSSSSATTSGSSANSAIPSRSCKTAGSSSMTAAKPCSKPHVIPVRGSCWTLSLALSPKKSPDHLADVQR